MKGFSTSTALPASIASMAAWADRQRRGDAVVWATIEGFFWFPRTLMGFEKLMFAFSDQPELLHRINTDLLEFNFRLLDQIFRICVPTFMTIAEDLSYNHGPMISKRTFDEFVAPYYRQLVPRLLERQIMPFVDTDGDVTLLAPSIFNSDSATGATTSAFVMSSSARGM